MATLTKKSPQPGAGHREEGGNSGGGDGALSGSDNTSALYSPEIEVSVLRGLLASRAGAVVKLSQQLDARDFYGPHHAVIYTFIVAAASRLVRDGDEAAPLQPGLIQQELLSSGQLTDTVSAALVQAISGAFLPPVMSDVYRLAGCVKRMRLRRALESMGEELTRAACSGVDDDVRRCIEHVAFLPGLARYAGLEVGGV